MHVKIFAAKNKRTMSSLFEEALQDLLNKYTKK
jgi:hypothetical protein